MNTKYSMTRKIIGIYIIIFSLSGIIFILSLAWMISNISNIKAGEDTWFNYVFGINIYIFVTLLALGLLGLIINIITKYINRKK
jgi:hypothetical protein